MDGAGLLVLQGMGPGDTEISGYTARKTKPKELCDSEPSPLQDPASCNSLSSAQAPPQAAIMEEVHVILEPSVLVLATARKW